MKTILYLIALATVFSCKLSNSKTSSADTAVSASRTIYFTDLEGSSATIEQLIEDGELRLVGNELIIVNPDTLLVFGGDVADRGPNGIKLMRWLVKLKEKYKDRVTLIWGNRDLNKLKFLAAYDDLKSGKNSVFNEWLKKAGKQNTLENQLTWFFEENLGIRNFFSQLLDELVRLGDVSRDLPIEMQRAKAAEVILAQLKPQGEYFHYVELGQLTHVFGRSVFVHGGINESNMGVVPEANARSQAATWLGNGEGSLNKWGRNALAKVKRAVQQGIAPSEYLLSYADGQWNETIGAVGGHDHSVVYPIRTFQDGTPRVPPQRVVDFLASAEIDAEILGHTPQHISTPLLNENFLRVMSDVSYSTRNGYLVIEANGTVTGHCRTADGRLVKFRLRADYSRLSVDERTALRLDPHAGRLSYGYVVVGQVEETDDYLIVRYLEGHEVDARVVSKWALEGGGEHYPTTSLNEEAAKAARKLRETLTKLAKAPLDEDGLKDFIGRREIVWFSGASEGSWNRVADPDKEKIAKFADDFVASLDPDEHIIVTGGTDHGFEKAIHDAVERYNQKHPNRPFRALGLISEYAANASHLARVVEVFIAGYYWDDIGPVAIKLIKEFGGRAVFAGGGGIVGNQIDQASAARIAFHLMQGPEGAAASKATQFPSNAFDDAAQLKQQMKLKGKDCVTETGRIVGI